MKMRGAGTLPYKPSPGRFLVRMFRVGADEYSEPRHIFAVLDRRSLEEVWKLPHLAKKGISKEMFSAGLDYVQFTYDFDAFELDGAVDWPAWMEEDFEWIDSNEDQVWIPTTVTWDRDLQWGVWTNHVTIPTSQGPGDPHLKIESEHGFFESSSLPRAADLFPSIRNLKGSPSKLFDLDAYLK